MKKSETVKVINQAYDEWKFNPEVDCGLGDLILRAQEKAGMLPPFPLLKWELEDD